ncbi:RidA family protein [Kitasatospora sp. NPDC094016]|uniref:RidA family protein n=1 Tax=Kitasatospora sp. NPDC094016 TaxID=3154986 RepID=UPI00332BBC8A
MSFGTVSHSEAGATASEDALSADATGFGGLVCTTQIPDREDGSIELGDMREQTRQTLTNLANALRRANSDLSRLLHLTIYLTDIEDRGIFNEVYAEIVPRPYPARCCVAVAALAIEGMRVEVTALAAQAGVTPGNPASA